MTTLPIELTSSFDQYESMQAEHLDAIRAYKKTPPDLERHNFERSRAFENLKSQLASILKLINRNEDDSTVQMGLACQDRLALINKQDERLARHIMAYRDMLKKQQCHMIQGRKALQGYQNSGF